MLRLYRKWKYGDTTTNPLYVPKKNKWLYKNKWVTRNTVINQYTMDIPSYSFIKNDGKVCTTSSFDEVIQAAIDNSLRKFVDIGEFSAQELHVINTIKGFYSMRIFSNYCQEMEDIAKKYNFRI